MKDKNGNEIPESHFENDLDFNIVESNKKYSPEFLERKQALIERLKGHSNAK